MNDIPDWANFHAVDKNGTSYFHQYEPHIATDNYWMGARLIRDRYNPFYINWKESLVEVREHIDPKYYRGK